MLLSQYNALGLTRHSLSAYVRWLMRAFLAPCGNFALKHIFENMYVVMWVYVNAVVLNVYTFVLFKSWTTGVSAKY